MARFDGRAILVSKDDPQMQSDRSLIDPSRVSKLTTGFGAPVREGELFVHVEC